MTRMRNKVDDLNNKIKWNLYFPTVTSATWKSPNIHNVTNDNRYYLSNKTKLCVSMGKKNKKNAFLLLGKKKKKI
jgi:hypothetical protein